MHSRKRSSKFSYKIFVLVSVTELTALLSANQNRVIFMYIVTKCNTASKIQSHLHRAPLPSDLPALSSMRAFYSHQSFPSAYEPAPPPARPAKQRSALFLVPCAVVYTQPRLAVGPLPSLGNGHEFLRTFSFKISLCQSKTRLYKKVM